MPCDTKLSSNKNAKSDLTLTPNELDYIYTVYINLAENCKKNDEQTCSKQKIFNVSSLNECHKIYTSSRARKTEHIRSTQNCATPF